MAVPRHALEHDCAWIQGFGHEKEFEDQQGSEENGVEPVDPCCAHYIQKATDCEDLAPAAGERYFESLTGWPQQ